MVALPERRDIHIVLESISDDLNVATASFAGDELLSPLDFQVTGTATDPDPLLAAEKAYSEFCERWVPVRNETDLAAASSADLKKISWLERVYRHKSVEQLVQSGHIPTGWSRKNPGDMVAVRLAGSDDVAAVPRALVSFRSPQWEQRSLPLNSIGWACHSDEHAAKVSSLLELVERDAILRHWYERKPANLVSEEIAETIFGRVEIRTWRLTAFDQCHCFASVAATVDTLPRASALGLGTSLGSVAAANKSRNESIQILQGMFAYDISENTPRNLKVSSYSVHSQALATLYEPSTWSFLGDARGELLTAHEFEADEFLSRLPGETLSLAVAANSDRVVVRSINSALVPWSYDERARYLDNAYFTRRGLNIGESCLTPPVA